MSRSQSSPIGCTLLGAVLVALSTLGCTTVGGDPPDASASADGEASAKGVIFRGVRKLSNQFVLTNDGLVFELSAGAPPKKVAISPAKDILGDLVVTTAGELWQMPTYMNQLARPAPISVPPPKRLVGTRSAPLVERQDGTVFSVSNGKVDAEYPFLTNPKACASENFCSQDSYVCAVGNDLREHAVHYLDPGSDTANYTYPSSGESVIEAGTAQVVTDRRPDGDSGVLRTTVFLTSDGRVGTRRRAPGETWVLSLRQGLPPIAHLHDDFAEDQSGRVWFSGPVGPLDIPATLVSGITKFRCTNGTYAGCSGPDVTDCVNPVEIPALAGSRPQLTPSRIVGALAARGSVVLAVFSDGTVRCWAGEGGACPVPASNP